MSEKAVVVITDRRYAKEFLALTEEAGFDPAGVLYVRNVTSSILSDHKLNELKELVNKADGVSKVLFDLELRPRQAYRIARGTGVEPLDRIQVILKIFLAHAPSEEAKLQVKLASLRYELARAKEKVRLAKMGEQPGFSGLGAYEVDKYYDEIKYRIQRISRRLERIRARREVHRIRRLRKNIKTISITGYTCSGKTTLFNLLTGALERVGEEPFTTLSTKFKLVKIGVWRVYLSDTIGFISKLPPFMVHAFRSTLEEISFSDLVVLMVDGGEPTDIVKEKLRESYNILVDLGVVNKPIIIAVNKLDLVSDPDNLREIRWYAEEISPYVVEISAKKGTNVNKLISLIKDLLGETRRVEITIPYGLAKFYRIIDLIKREGRVLKLSHNDVGMIVEAEVPDELSGSLIEKLRDAKGAIVRGA